MVYACFVAKMSKMAFSRFGGQFQFEKSNGGQVRQFWGRGAMGGKGIKCMVLILNLIVFCRFLCESLTYARMWVISTR